MVEHSCHYTFCSRKVPYTRESSFETFVRLLIFSDLEKDAKSYIEYFNTSRYFGSVVYLDTFPTDNEKISFNIPHSCDFFLFFFYF